MQFFTFLRHGRSQADDENRFEARYDSPLTDVGKRQTRELADRWKDDTQRRYVTIVSSPLLRARETAEIVGEVLSVPVSVDERWLEINAGAMTVKFRLPGSCPR